MNKIKKKTLKPHDIVMFYVKEIKFVAYVEVSEHKDADGFYCYAGFICYKNISGDFTNTLYADRGNGKWSFGNNEMMFKLSDEEALLLKSEFM